MQDDNSYLNPMAVWLLPKEDCGLKAVDRLKKGLNELASMPKSGDIEQFKTMKRASAQNTLSKPDKGRSLLAD